MPLNDAQFMEYLGDGPDRKAVVLHSTMTVCDPRISHIIYLKEFLYTTRRNYKTWIISELNITGRFDRPVTG